MKYISHFILFVFLSMGISSCKKKVPATNYIVRLTDDPGPYQAVNIDLRAIELIGDGGQPISLPTNQGIYNLLDFTDGQEITVATGGVHLVNIEQIRLILGPNNTVFVDGDTYPLSTPSAEQSGLKVNVHQTLQPGVSFSVLLDFDANQSIVKEGNGTYKLKPVIRTVELTTTGSIQGKIEPKGIAAIVSAGAGNAFYSTTVSHNGHFTLKGLPPGIYSLTLMPEQPYAPVELHQVNVVNSSSTDIGTIHF